MLGKSWIGLAAGDVPAASSPRYNGALKISDVQRVLFGGAVWGRQRIHRPDWRRPREENSVQSSAGRDAVCFSHFYSSSQSRSASFIVERFERWKLRKLRRDVDILTFPASSDRINKRMWTPLLTVDLFMRLFLMMDVLFIFMYYLFLFYFLP